MKQLITANIDSNWPKVEIEYHKKIELFVDSLHGFDVNKESYKIFYLREPNEVHKMDDFIIQNSNQFDLILTTSKKVLDSCKNSVIMEFGTAWIFNYNFPEKIFQISMIMGIKDFTEGHRLRKKVFYKQSLIKNPIDFYISNIGYSEDQNPFNNKILGDKKEPLFDSQFHICIENSKQEYWFTEKLIDCFVTKTIPIYWGFSNINQYFNTKGIIIANSFNEIIEKCNSINESTYESMKEAIEDNFKLAQKFIYLQPRIKEKIEKNLK